MTDDISSKKGRETHPPSCPPHQHHLTGPRQPEPFDPQRAALLDDTERFDYLPPSQIVQMLELEDGMTVVDFGAGTGLYSAEIARYRPSVQVIAYDIQPEMLAMMRSKPALNSSRITVCGPSEIAAYKGQADRLLALNVLHELDDDSLQLARELLARRGFALLIDWDARVPRPVGPPPEHTYTLEEALDRLKRLGFAAESLPNRLRFHFAIRSRASS